ncbi:MAG TPA: hypothetical protein VLC09_22130, partial [Polyangiaceae bacterium]|nr:hypothetical protein [Polyangiaceae bacterium]
MLRRMLPLLTLALVWLAYLQVLDAPLVWDDRRLILSGEAWADRPNWYSHFIQPFWNRANFAKNPYYRPLSTLSLQLDHLLHGDISIGFHLTNLLLHSLNALMLQRLLMRRGVRPSVAFLVTVAWALQPRLTEAAAWASGRTDVLACSFVLLALHVYGRESAIRGVLSALLVFLGMLAKEVAVGGFVTLLLLDWLGGAPAALGKAEARRPVRVAFGACLVGYVGLRHWALGHRLAGSWPPLRERWWHPLEALGRYSYDICLPWMPRLQQGELDSPSWSFIAGGAVVLLSFLVFMGRRLRSGWPIVRSEPIGDRDWLRTAGTSLFVVSLLPVLHLVPIPTMVVAADRFLYVPTLGLALV